MATRSQYASAAAAGGGASAQQAAPLMGVSSPFVPRASNELETNFERLSEEHSGIIKIRRLLFIGERCPSLAVPAFRIALRDLKAAQPMSSFSLTSKNPVATSAVQALGPNPQLYLDVLSRARELLLTPSAQPEQAYFLSAGAAGKVAADALFSMDGSYHSSAARSFTEIQHNLENQLMIQKRDGERDQIKVASLNLAEFYLNRGDLNSSLNKYLESKEFVNQSATPQTNLELLNIALNVIKCSVLLLNMSHVKTQVQRAQRLCKEVATGAAQQAAASSTGNASEADEATKLVNCKLNAAMGLFHMKSNAYHSAAQSFVAVTSHVQGAYSDVLSGRDIATYGAITALASMSRKELKDQVLNNVEFKKLLDLNVPTTWKLILQQFYNSNYAKVFELIESIKNDLYLDIFLSAHVNRLIRQIRERAFIQYFKAYVSVELSVMSVAFNLDMATLERTLADLIQENKIAARIDSHKKILHARHADQRHDTFTQALQLGNRYVRDVRSVLMRLSLVENDMAVRAPGGGGEKRGGKGRMAMTMSEEEHLQRSQQMAFDLQQARGGR